jgi:lysozyme
VKVSDAGVALIKEFEGFPFGGKPYRDCVGVWTIGYGHTEAVGPDSQRLTQQQASELLAADLDKKYAPSVDAVGVALSQHQFDALVSFVYNCGGGAVGTQTGVGKSLRAREFNAAADHLLEWNKGGGHVIAGLTRRRHAERAMFLQKDDPLEGYTDNEKHWIREYDRLLREHKNEPRRRELRQDMAQQRKAIWRGAQPKAKGGDGQGWDHAHRRARYASLLARTQ